MEALSAGERESLLGLARGSILQSLQSDDSLTRLLERTEITDGLERPRAAFVSLKLPNPDGGRDLLRGCIGNMGTALPLYLSVIEMARKAALSDPRFPPLRIDALKEVRIEISALGATVPVAGPEEIVVGRHGVELNRGAARAVFLPHVATELGWTREEMLGQLARKAGLAADGWREAELAVFEADVFGEG